MTKRNRFIGQSLERHSAPGATQDHYRSAPAHFQFGMQPRLVFPGGRLNFSADVRESRGPTGVPAPAFGIQSLTPVLCSASASDLTSMETRRVGLWLIGA